MTACRRGPEVIPVLGKLTALHDYYGNETAEAMNDLRNLAAALLQQKRPQDA